MDETLQLLIKHKLLHIFLNIVITEKVLEIKKHNSFMFNKSVHEQNNEVNKKRKFAFPTLINRLLNTYFIR